MYLDTSLKETLHGVGTKLAASGVSNSKRESEELVAAVLGLSWGQMMAQMSRLLKSHELKQIEKVLLRRQKGEPLAYILQKQEFFGHTFYVNKGVLIPRPETEILVEQAISSLPKERPVRVADLGCGTGCIGLSLAKQSPLVKVLLIDKSPAAIEASKINALNLGVTDQVELQLREINHQDLRLALDWAPLDIIVANPPYIAMSDNRVDWQVEKYEPHEALFAGEQGLEWIHKWLAWSYHNLIRGGVAFFEIGIGQAEHIPKIVSDRGLKLVEIKKDYQGIDRIVQVRKVN